MAPVNLSCCHSTIDTGILYEIRGYIHIQLEVISELLIGRFGYFAADLPSHAPNVLVSGDLLSNLAC